MDTLQIIVLAIVQGFTEFLPISSTGHMIVASEYLGVKQNALTDAYEIIIQFAAILAVILIYREKITFKQHQLWFKLIWSFIPLGMVGFVFKDKIARLFNVEIVAWMFIIGGVIFLIVEYFYKEKSHHISKVEDVSYGQAMGIGIMQIFSLIPGTSRSGATIIGGLLLGLDRKTSSDFSFLLAIPVMMSVSGYSLFHNYEAFMGVDYWPFIIGFIVAFVVAYITVKLFLVFIQKFSFVPFGIYRIIFGIFLLMII